MSSFLKRLYQEIKSNGKLLAGYAVTQIPGITSFPGLTTSIHTAIADRTPASYLDVGAQLLLAIGATMRAKKIVVNAANKSGSEY